MAREAASRTSEELTLNPAWVEQQATTFLPTGAPTCLSRTRLTHNEDDAGGRALEAQCESCGQWTYLTCGDLTRERASCIATEPAQRASKRPHPIERVQADALLRRDLPGVRPDRPSSPHRGCLWEPTNALRRRRGLRQTACSDREGAAAPPPPARWGSERLSGHGAATGRATEKASPSHTQEPPLESSSA